MKTPINTSIRVAMNFGMRKALALFGLFMSISLFSVFFSGCERRPLEDGPFSTALVPIRAYWDLAAQGLPDGEWSVQNATVLIYDGRGDLFLEKEFESQPQYAQTQVELPEGDYTVVVFNELRGQVENVDIRGHERLSTLEAYSIPSPTSSNTSGRAAGDLMVLQPGHLAAIVFPFSVTPELITRTRATNRTSTATLDRLMDLHPTRKTTVVHITARVQLLNYAMMPALVDLRHMSEAYHFASDRNIFVPATTQFTMNNRQYDTGSTTDGTIHTTVTTFGLPGIRNSIDDLQHPVLLEFLFKLIDNKTIVVKSADITRQMEIKTDPNAAVEIRVNIDAGPLPKVDVMGGMSELVDWTGEEINVEL